MRGKAVTVNVRMPKAAKGKKRSRRGPWQSLKSTGWVRGSPDSVTRFGPTRMQATPEQLAQRKAWHYYGNGMYAGRGGFWGDLWNKTAGIRHTLGGAARSGAFGPVGQAIGGVTGALGIGDYTTGDHVVSNDIVNEGSGQGIPQFAEGPKTVTISHKEYVADIFGPQTAGTFQNQTFGLNPALLSTFPWLAQVACNYDEYTFHQLIFTYRSTVTDFVAANGQVGSIIMATQYNANDSPFTSKQDAMEYDGAVSAKVSEKILHGVECDPTKLSGAPGKYTRSGPPTVGEDIKTYDLGTLNVSVSNTPAAFANQAIGELWVSYTVELRKPKFFATRGQAIQTDIWMGREPAAGAAELLGDLTIGVAQQNRIGGSLVKSLPDLNPTTGAVLYPANTHKLYYVLPDSFSGDCEIQITSGITSGPQQAYILAVSNPTLGILPINDMWNAGGWSHKNENPTAPTGGGPGLYQGTSHWRIVAPTSAQAAGAMNNVITIASDSYFNALIFKITVYNTGMNYTRSNEVIMQNPTTGQVETWA